MNNGVWSIASVVEKNFIDKKIQESRSLDGASHGCYWEGWQRVEMGEKIDMATRLLWLDRVIWRTNKPFTDGRDDDMSISETKVVLDPCIMVSEEESGTKAMKNTEVHTSGDLASC